VTPTTEFSHIVTVEPWPEDGLMVDVAATDVECRRLKERFDLVDLRALKASGAIRRAGDELVFKGRLEAEVVQACVATLKPVPAVVNAPFERRFRRHDKAASTSRRREVDLLDGEADVEILETDHIDVGDVIAEEFYLALDPYPRAGDADLVLAEGEGARRDDDASDHPFAKLRRH
jgi:uncharacterized metal-binding protein YceD (DUF177 family)